MKKRHQELESSARSPIPTNSTAASYLQEEIRDWLQDAYGMEQTLEEFLQKQAHNNELSPQLQTQLQDHLVETKKHITELKRLLKDLGVDVSSTQPPTGMSDEIEKGFASAFKRDESIIDILNAYSMEHFEIASYLALIAASEKAGLSDVTETCRQILRDEERMAKALQESLPAEVSSYLNAIQV